MRPLATLGQERLTLSLRQLLRIADGLAVYQRDAMAAYADARLS